MGLGGKGHAPAALPPGMTRYPLYRRLGGPQCRSRQVRKISPPPGFDPRTVQPVASRYTDSVIPVLLLLLLMRVIRRQVFHSAASGWHTITWYTIFDLPHSLPLKPVNVLHRHILKPISMENTTTK